MYSFRNPSTSSLCSITHSAGQWRREGAIEDFKSTERDNNTDWVSEASAPPVEFQPVTTPEDWGNLQHHGDQKCLPKKNYHDQQPRFRDPDRIQLSGELFEAVQHSRVFSDSKQYVDMLATLLPATVIEKFKKERDKPGFDLSRFVNEHFELPELLGVKDNLKKQENCRSHIKELWPLLFRHADDDSIPHSTLIPLPHPYVVPGGRFREIYYWDSYFTSHGLIADGHKEMALSMAKNFRHMIQTCGHIPNGNRFYYLSRSQPPFYIPMLSLLTSVFGEQIIPEFYQEAVVEYSYWMDEAGDSDRRFVAFRDSHGQEHMLNRYWDDHPVPREESWIEDKKMFDQSHRDDSETFFRHIRAGCESGWDFSSRWLEDKNSLTTIETTNILPVDLNTVLWYCETKLAEWSESLGHTSASTKYKTMANKRKASLNELMWDESEGFFFDFHINRKEHTRCHSLAAVYPLYFGLASRAQAEAVADKLEKQFLKDGGLMTTLTTSGQQWDAPNGWAPLQWMAIVGLEHYGLNDLAEMIRTRWLRLNERVYAETGKMMEKYDVLHPHKRGGGGEYPLQDGFGWTNGVFSALSGHLDDFVDPAPAAITEDNET